jgi:hypothetical protein
MAIANLTHDLTRNAVVGHDYYVTDGKSTINDDAIQSRTVTPIMGKSDRTYHASREFLYC